ncbi:MAG: hypothetical protein WBM28_07040 [Burkholderiales bacterium]
MTKLNVELTRILNTAEMKEFLAKQGTEVCAGSARGVHRQREPALCESGQGGLHQGRLKAKKSPGTCPGLRSSR